MKKNLAINFNDGKIPKLKSSNFKTLNYDGELYDYLEKDDTEDGELISFAEKKYGKLILDFFEFRMEENDPRLDLLSNDYFRLSQENKYLSLIEEIFKVNNHTAYIDFVNFSDKAKLLQFLESRLNRLDRIDTYILLNQMDILTNPGNSGLYLIEDLNLLKLFVKGFLREIFWCNLYFPKKPIIIGSGYDLGLITIIKNSEDKQLYQKLAAKNELFFR